MRLVAVILLGLAPATMLFAMASGPAWAQPAPGPACPAQVVRWQDDCAALRDRSLQGLDRLRFQPLGSDAFVSFGGEARVRVEGFASPDFGLGGPDYLSLAARGLVHADLRTDSGPRLFAQLSVAEETGRRPGPRPFDESDIDLAQGFIDLPASTALGRLILRAGRQELALGTNRLVGLRDGVSLRRAFDAARISLQGEGYTGQVFIGRPVRALGGAFDDESDRADRFGGLVVDIPGARAGNTLQLFLFSRLRDTATYFGASGRDRRETIGFRQTRAGPGWDTSLQMAVQVGRTGGRQAESWGMGAEVGRQFGDATPTRVALLLGVASGDSDPTDDVVRTFDPLYPNLGAFSSAPLYFPANQVNIGLVASRPVGPVTLSGDVVLLGRYSTDDAVYANPGRPLIAPTATDARWSAVISEVAVSARLAPRVEVQASVVHAFALDAVRDAGGEDATFAQLQLTSRF